MTDSHIPRVSVGLPVYNGERYLAQAIESVLRQTYTDFEFIISDNCSTDGTEAMCRAYAAKDPRVRYYRCEHNMGASWNYNRVFALARGEYFKWVAYDDAAEPPFIERCIEILDREPDVVLCYPRAVDIDGNGKEIGQREDLFEFRSDAPHQRFRAFLKVADKTCCNAMFGVIRRDVLAKTRLIDNYHSSDKVMLGDLSLRGKFAEVKDRLFIHRLHAGMSTEALKSAKEIATWYDTSRKGKRAFPKLRRLKEYTGAIQRSGISAWQRWYCYVHLGLYYLALDKWGRLFRRLIGR